jgi:hypothetical protein
MTAQIDRHKRQGLLRSARRKSTISSRLLLKGGYGSRYTWSRELMFYQSIGFRHSEHAGSHRPGRATTPLSRVSGVTPYREHLCLQKVSDDFYLPVWNVKQSELMRSTVD